MFSLRWLKTVSSIFRDNSRWLWTKLINRHMNLTGIFNNPYPKQKWKKNLSLFVTKDHVGLASGLLLFCCHIRYSGPVQRDCFSSWRCRRYDQWMNKSTANLFSFVLPIQARRPRGQFRFPLCLCFCLGAKPFLMKMTDLHENETARRTHFHMKGFTLRLVLKQRRKRTWKWPIK